MKRNNYSKVFYFLRFLPIFFSFLKLNKYKNDKNINLPIDRNYLTF